MDRAKRLVREERWNEAITACREIIQRAPKMYEARFNLARVYQMAGHLGLALHEYNKLRNLRDEIGPNHVFVLESERAIEELREVSSKEKEDFFLLNI
jgi:tetratricopeptide (TPR) repeat protein